MRQDWEVPEDWDYACPFGITLEKLKLMPPAPVIPIIHPPNRGLGDTLARFINWISFGRIKPCYGCRKRHKLLNKWFPYNQH